MEGEATAASRVSQMVQVAVAEVEKGAPQVLEEIPVPMWIPPQQNLGVWLPCCGEHAGMRCAQLQAQGGGAPAAS